MKREIHNKFNEEVNRYRKALLFHAKKCDWGTFKLNAGRLFDYVEAIEMSEIERRFFAITKGVVAILFFMVLFIVKMNPHLYPQLERLNELMTIAAVAVCCFEVYFFYNFRIYMTTKTALYNKRRETFIRDIEQDFREMALSAAA